MARKLYTEKSKKRPSQKIDNTGLAIVPNYNKKRIDKKASHNARELGKMTDIIWSE